MGRAENIQLNVRSAFARDRVHALTKLTGMTASEVIEDALRGVQSISLFHVGVGLLFVTKGNAFTATVTRLGKAGRSR